MWTNGSFPSGIYLKVQYKANIMHLVTKLRNWHYKFRCPLASSEKQIQVYCENSNNLFPSCYHTIASLLWEWGVNHGNN